MELEISSYEDGDLSLICSNFDFCREEFKRFDVNPTGHVWEDLIQIYCKEKDIDLGEIDFDSESDMFAASSQGEASLNVLKAAFEAIVNKPSILVSLLENYEEEESELWTVDEFLEHLDYNEIDRSKKLFLHFDLEFQKEENSVKACEEIADKNYPCYVGLEYENYPVAIGITAVPDKKFLSEMVEFASVLAEKYGGDFSYFCFYHENYFEELGHWRVYSSN